MPTETIAHLLNGEVPLGSTVIVNGWVRTRCDSKAGLSLSHITSMANVRDVILFPRTPTTRIFDPPP